MVEEIPFQCLRGVAGRVWSNGKYVISIWKNVKLLDDHDLEEC